METASALIFWISLGLVLYAYVIFPCALAVVAKLREDVDQGPEVPADDHLPRVAMVVAAFNEAKHIRGKLENTRRLDYPADRFELYIGSDGSTDQTAELLRMSDDPRFHVCVFQKRRGKISVINDLVSRVDADIIVMSDANTMFDPGSIKQLVKHFSDARIGCVSGEICLEQGGGVSGEGLYWRFENWIKRNESSLGFLIGCNGGIFALRSQLYKPLPASTIVDDFVISIRVLEMGYRVIIEAQARGYEHPAESTRMEMARKARIGAGNWQALGLTWPLLTPKYGLIAAAYWGHKVLRWATPVFVVAMIAAAAVLRSHLPYAGILDVNLAGIALSTIALSPRIGTRLPRATRPVTYFYLMNYSLLCGLVRFIGKTQKVTWETRSGEKASPPEASVHPAVVG